MINKKISELDYLKYKSVEEFLEANKLDLDAGLAIMKQEIEQIEKKNLERENKGEKK